MEVHALGAQGARDQHPQLAPDLELLAGQRPRDPAIFKKNAARFANIKLFTVDQALGGWAKVSKTHFADGGTYDQVMAGIKR